MTLTSKSLVSLAIASIASIGQAQTGPQPKLPTINLQAGMHRIVTEMADNQVARSTGMMFRTDMAQHEGMLFVFPRKEAHCFWMRNTLVPLTIAFLEDDGTIVNTADMKAKDETSHCAAKPVRYALEVNQGWFVRKGIKPGSKLTGLPKTKD